LLAWHLICACAAKFILLKMREKLLKLVLALGFVFGLTINASAQANYNTAVGLRIGGYENGITLKHFINSDTALEGIIGFRPGVFVVTGLYEKHAVAFAEPSLTWFYGAGAHIGGISEDRYYRAYGKDRYYDNSGILLGADGILGLEWQIPELPVSTSLDLHPRIELARGPFLDLEAALTIRYTF
jgi:hypothetical protein